MHTKLRSMPIFNICLSRPQSPFSEQDKNDVFQFIKRLVRYIQYSMIQKKLLKYPEGIIELIVDIVHLYQLKHSQMSTRAVGRCSS